MRAIKNIQIGSEIILSNNPMQPYNYLDNYVMLSFPEKAYKFGQQGSVTDFEYDQSNNRELYTLQYEHVDPEVAALIETVDFQTLRQKLMYGMWMITATQNNNEIQGAQNNNETVREEIYVHDSSSNNDSDDDSVTSI